jgi:hypothetical protein
MKWIKTVRWKHANSTYRDNVDDNFLKFLLHFQNFRSSIICDSMSVLFSEFYTVNAYWKLFLLHVNQLYLQRQILSRRRWLSMMIKKLFNRIWNSENSFAVMRCEISSEYSFRSKDRACMNCSFFSKFWKILTFYDRVFLMIDRFEYF